MYEKLEKIRELKEKGVLSDSEFETEKRKVLNESSPSPQQSQQPPNTIKKEVINNVKVHSGSGIAGFVLALVASSFYLQPLTVMIYGLAGLIFSIIGMSKPKQKYNRGLATAGLVIAILTILGGLVMLRVDSIGGLYTDKTGAIDRY